MVEQKLRAGEARIDHVHDSGRDPGEPNRSRFALDIAFEWMRLVRAFASARRRSDVDKHTAALAPHRKRRHLVRFEPGFAHPGATMEFPAMPRTDYIVLI